MNLLKLLRLKSCDHPELVFSGLSQWVDPSTQTVMAHEVYVCRACRKTIDRKPKPLRMFL